MKVGIMQPYFIPYIGYWQLMNAVDKYVIYDDVNYIKGGWINRNRILVDGNPRYFNVPMKGATPNILINEVRVDNNNSIINKNLRRIEGAYKKAPYYGDVYPMMEKILWCGKENIVEFIEYSFHVICDYLNIHTDFLMSSDLDKDNDLRGQDKVLAICSQLNATEYYNAIGGKKLYSHEIFNKHGVQLKFMKTNDICYKQFGGEFQSNLSILDVMMFNSIGKIKEYMEEYTLVME